MQKSRAGESCKASNCVSDTSVLKCSKLLTQFKNKTTSQWTVLLKRSKVNQFKVKESKPALNDEFNNMASKVINMIKI